MAADLALSGDGYLLQTPQANAHTNYTQLKKAQQL